METIILKIKEEMKKQGLSEQRLADMAGLSQNKVHRIVTGKVKKLDIQAINQLNKALGFESELEIKDRRDGVTEAGENFGFSLEDQLAYEEWKTLSPDQKLLAVQMLRKLKAES